MEKLLIPKGAIIQGERVSIIHQGDIQIENNLVPLSIKSKQGSIYFIPENEKISCSHLIAEEGEISVHAGVLSAELVSAASITLEVKDLDVAQAVQSRGKAEIRGDKLRTGDLIAGSLEIRMKDFVEVSTIEVDGELTIVSGTLKAQMIKAKKINLEIGGKLECDRLVAEEDVIVGGGNISVKFLDCSSFTAAPEVTGIIMVATPDHVKAEGVRGFIRPQEFQAFADKDALLQVSAGKKVEHADQEQDQPKAQEDSTPHEPEILESPAEPEIKTEPVSTFETMDVEALEKADLEPEELPDFEQETPSEEETQMEQEIANIQEEAVEDFEVESEELSDNEPPSIEMDSFSVDEIPIETLNVDDDIADEDVEEVQIGPDTVSDEQEISMDLNDMEEELLSSDLDNEQSLDNLDALTEEEELAMDSAEMAAESAGEAPWEQDPDFMNVEAFPMTDKAGGIPVEDDDFKTTELNFGGQESMDPSDDFESEDLSFGPDAFDLDDFQPEDPTGDFDSVEILDEPDSIEMTEDDLVQVLAAKIEDIKSCFPDENFPKFISQIEVYLKEKRFQILRKSRNREAVLSSFDRLENPKISELAREFYKELLEFFGEQI